LGTKQGLDFITNTKLLICQYLLFFSVFADIFNFPLNNELVDLGEIEGLMEDPTGNFFTSMKFSLDY
jgi:hypothetical protein